MRIELINFCLMIGDEFSCSTVENLKKKQVLLLDTLAPSAITTVIKT